MKRRPPTPDGWLPYAAFADAEARLDRMEGTAREMIAAKVRMARVRSRQTPTSGSLDA